MSDIRIMARVSIALGTAAIVALGVSHLALTDILHGEGDLALEWRVLQIAFVVVLGAQLFAIATLGRVIRSG